MKKMLIANRGEIAIRVMTTAQKMGIKTVAVYSEADREAPFVMMADEAVYIGQPAASESYLRGDKILEAAKKTGAEAIHPGYGFLSENAEFAQSVIDNGFIFVGPLPSSIRIMGSKLKAKAAVKQYNIPMVPGTDKPVTDPKVAIKIAEDVGYPILIKASAGGGGKGMRVVEKTEDLVEQMERAISEATSAFGDGSVFIEKFVTQPRHIEIQVVADQHGSCVHLFERECSIQRRHQKVVEEAPSAILTEATRAQMGADAVKVAQACNYVGAGTVEFLMDGDGKYYFLEMNTRLQVEHPVTELITGLDLVELQIQIAEGKPLPFKQDDLSINGHALELRLYAEDPLNDFLPDIGTLHTYRPPSGENIRIDNGYREGMEIPIYYDPMLAKVIAYGKDRRAAIAKMLEIISNFKIEGVANTLSFGAFVCKHEAFVSGNFDTNFVKEHYSQEIMLKSMEDEAKVATGLAEFLQEKYRKTLKMYY